MSHLVVIIFEHVAEAGRVREAMARLEQSGLFSLDDSAVVVKDSRGRVRVDNQIDRGIKGGAVSGGLIGLMIGFIFFPLGGLIIGTLGGALIGKMANLGVDKRFIQEVGAAIGPSTSALFLIVRHADPNAVVTALKPYRGTVYQTPLTTEAEETLRPVMSEQQMMVKY